MRLKLKQLMAMQDELDCRIFDQHKITREATHQRRILAALVEIGECANETRCFKFWSIKKPSEVMVILEEYVDILHFMLSLAIDYQIQIEELEAMKANEDLSMAFLDLYRMVADLTINDKADLFENSFAYFLGLGEGLGFDEKMVIDAYNMKNAENFKRQDRNY